MVNSFYSYDDAEAYKTQAESDYPEATFDIVQIPMGNRIAWEVVQTNRFLSDD